MSEGTAGQGVCRLGFQGRSSRWELEGFPDAGRDELDRRDGGSDEARRGFGRRW